MTAEVSQSFPPAERVEDQPTPCVDVQIPLESLVHVGLSSGADRVSLMALKALSSSDVVLSYRQDDVEANGGRPLRVARI